MIYVASPYSHPDAAVREARFRDVCRAAARLMRAGHPVFSPIAHSHPIAQHGLPVDWHFWEPFDRAHLEQCDELVVLTLDGWRESVGVQAEIRIAGELGNGMPRIDMGSYELLVGDVNGDGQVSDQDVAPFLEVLLHGPYSPTADMTQDGAVDGLDCDPLMAAVASAAAGAAQESTGDQGLDVAVDKIDVSVDEIDVTSTALPEPTIAEAPTTIATELPRGRRFRGEDQETLLHQSNRPFRASDEQLSRLLQRPRHNHNSHDGDDRPRMLPRAAVERVYAGQLRFVGQHLRDARRSALEDVYHQAQRKPIGDWQAAVDRAFEEDASWLSYQHRHT